MVSLPERRQGGASMVFKRRDIHDPLRRSDSVHSRISNQISGISQDYPVFSPSYEDEPSPQHFSIRFDRNLRRNGNRFFPNGNANDSEFFQSCNKSPDHLSFSNNENPVWSANPCLDYKMAMNNASGSLNHSTKNGKHSSSNSQMKSKGKAFSWLFLRTKRKHGSDLRLATIESEDMLKKELQEADEKRRLALREVAEMRISMRDLKQKMIRLECYCEELKIALKQEIQEEETLILSTLKRSLLINRTIDGTDDSMPVSYEVMAESFFQMVSEARLNMSNFCEALASRIDETDSRLMEKINTHLKETKNSKEVIYILEALINQPLYQDFENIIFQKSGSSKVLDPHQSRLESFSAFVSFRNMSWSDVLSKATDYYSKYFKMFCDQKMNSIISVLNWWKPWPELLLQSFFTSAKCIWLLHLLAFSFNPPVMIFRVDENMNFDPLYMEDVFEGKQLSEETQAKVMAMAMPGFYMNETVIRCTVMCK